MKKWIKGFGVFLITLVSVLCTSCHRPSHESDYQPDKDDVEFVKASLEKLNNPKFSNVEKVVSYQLTGHCTRYQDSVFYSLPVETLKQVAQVLFNRGDAVTKRTIVNEFLDGKNIYTNLGKIEQFKSLDNDTTCVDCQSDKEELL